MTEHVRLLAGFSSSGSPRYEVLPGQRLADGEWVLLGTPALAEGAASGDTLRIAPDGEFAVVRRGGNIGIVSYAQADGDLSRAAADLSAVIGLRGLVEADPQGRWCVVTIPVTVGFDWIEQVMGEWCKRTGAIWSYLNVHDEDGEPLGWWA